MGRPRRKAPPASDTAPEIHAWNESVPGTCVVCFNGKFKQLLCGKIPSFPEYGIDSKALETVGIIAQHIIKHNGKVKKRDIRHILQHFPIARYIDESIDDPISAVCQRKIRGLVIRAVNKTLPPLIDILRKYIDIISVCIFLIVILQIKAWRAVRA